MSRAGRRYLGVCAPGRRFKQVLIRVYVAQLQAAWKILGRQPGAEADAYMTLVGYFNSLRELGGMRRLVEDDVQSRLFGGARRRGARPADPRGADLPQVGRRHPAGARPARRRPRAPRMRASSAGTAIRSSIDVLLATNMISVGVDVPRLGAMVVAGQPKSTSEYIQATSRDRAPPPGPRDRGLQLGAAAGPLALRDVLPLPPHPVPAGRGVLGHAVRAAGA